eukprot:6192320-Pleurochrysis_carterae.AAC.2
MHCACVAFPKPRPTSIYFASQNHETDTDTDIILYAAHIAMMLDGTAAACGMRGSTARRGMYGRAMAVSGVTALEARSASLLQKVWRGELARRMFSELYFNACVADLRQRGLDAEEEQERASKGLSDRLSHPGSEGPELDTSLEEAHLEALSGSHFINAARSEENVAVPSDGREAASSSSDSPLASKVDGTGGDSRLTGADNGDSQSPGTAHPPLPRKRFGGATGGYRFAVGPEGLGELAELQFTEEMANEMDLTTLQELASVTETFCTAHRPMCQSLGHFEHICVLDFALWLSLCPEVGIDNPPVIHLWQVLSRIIVARNKNLMSLLQVCACHAWGIE